MFIVSRLGAVALAACILGCGTSSQPLERAADGASTPTAVKPPPQRIPKIEVQQCHVEAARIGEPDKDGFRRIKVVATAELTTDVDLTKQQILAKVRGPDNMTYSDKKAAVEKLPDGRLRFSAELRCPVAAADYRLLLFTYGKPFYEAPLELND